MIANLFKGLNYTHLGGASMYDKYSNESREVFIEICYSPLHVILTNRYSYQEKVNISSIEVLLNNIKHLDKIKSEKDWERNYLNRK